MKILIVDDQRSARKNLTSLLEAFPDVESFEAATLAEARRALEQRSFDLALIDIRLSEDARDRSGLVLLREIVDRSTCVAVCVTASNEMETIRAAMRVGAYDYLLKDGLCEETIGHLLSSLSDRRRLEQEVLTLRTRVAAEGNIPGILGSSPAIERLRQKIRRVAVAEAPVLVLGPTGSGKELVARAIHQLGAHPGETILEVNCGAIPPSLIESQLFGHVKGAFTSAERREGVLATVGSGTLFLDEVGELPLEMQTRLLRVLETRDFTPVGSETPRRFQGRVVAATHVDLAEMVANRRFREDLYYRLQVLTLRVPSLDERTEDIPALVAHFCKLQRRSLRFTTEALDQLMCERWPGNVRQLRNLVESVAVFADAEVVTPAVIRDVTERQEVGIEELVRQHVRALLRAPIPAQRMQMIERAIIEEALSMNDQNKSAAARLLDVHRKFVERRADSTRPSAPPDDE